MMNTPTTLYNSSSYYTNFVQQQQQAASSIFISAATALQNDIISNVLKAVDSEKDRKENIIIITMCKLMERLHCNETLLKDILM
eukprot:UN07653